MLSGKTQAVFFLGLLSSGIPLHPFIMSTWSSHVVLMGSFLCFDFTIE